MKVEAYKSENGKLFATENEAISEDIKEQLTSIFVQYPCHLRLGGYTVGSICEKIIERRKEIIDLLRKIS